MTRAKAFPLGLKLPREAAHAPLAPDALHAVVLICGLWLELCWHVHAQLGKGFCKLPQANSRANRPNAGAHAGAELTQN